MGESKEMKSSCRCFENLLCRLEHIPLRSFHAGQILRDRFCGESVVGLILEGIVEVYSVAVDGRDVLLNLLHPGDCFGISNLFSEEEIKTVLRCKTQVKLRYLPKRELIALLENDAEAAMDYARHCSGKIQFLIRRIESLTISSARGKLIEYLLSEADEQGRVSPQCSREDLARRLGISRAALFRELSFLYGQEVIKTDGTDFFIADMQAMERLLYQSCTGQQDTEKGEGSL